MSENKTLLSSLPADLWGHIGFFLPLIELNKVLLAGNSATSTRIRHGVRNCGARWNRHGFASITALLKASRGIPDLTTLEITLEDYQRAEHPAKWENTPSCLRTLRLSFANCIESLCCLYDLDSILPNLEVLDLTNAPVLTPMVRTFSLKKLPPKLWSFSLSSPHPCSRIDLTDTSIFPRSLETLEIDYPPVVDQQGALAFSLPLLRTLRLNFGTSSCTFDINSLPSTITSLTLVPMDDMEDVAWTELFPDLSSLVLLPAMSPRDLEGHHILAHEEEEYQDWTDRHTLLVAPESSIPNSTSMIHLRGLLISDLDLIPQMTLIQSLSVPGVWTGLVELPNTLKFFEASYIIMEALPSLPQGLSSLKCSAILGIESDISRHEFFGSLSIIQNLDSPNSSGEHAVRHLFPSTLTKLVCTEYAMDEYVIDHLPSSLRELDIKFGWKIQTWAFLLRRGSTLPHLATLRDRASPRSSLTSLDILPPSIKDVSLNWLYRPSSSFNGTLTRLTIPSGEIDPFNFQFLPRSLLHLNIGTLVGNLCEQSDPINFGVKKLPPGLITLSIGSFQVDDDLWPEISEEAALALPKTLRRLQIESQLQRPIGLFRGIRLGVALIVVGNDMSIYTRRCQDSVPLEARYTELFPSSIMYC